jgi:hypothetical protein
MEYIVNSPKHGKQTVLLDDEDAHFCSQGLYVHKIGQFLYVRIKPKKIALHRAIMGNPKGKVIDHINRNALDNRKQNLRICTIQENLRNQKRPNNKTGTTGVSVHNYWKDKVGYEASIVVNYKKIYIGFYLNLEDAIKARKEAERKYFDT